MKIAVNALSVQGGGGETFLRNLLEHLLLVDRKNEYLVFVTPGKMETLKIHNDKTNLKILRCRERGWMARGFWEQLGMPRILRREKVDVLYAPGNQGPVFSRCQFVVLIQSVDPLYRGISGAGVGFEAKRKVVRWMMHASVHRARKVIAISEYTRRLLVREFRLSPDSIAVIPHGSPTNAGLPAAPEMPAQLRKAGVAAPYFLSVSNIKYNKNYENLVVAFAAAQREISHPVHLVIAGGVEDKRCFLRVQDLIRKNDVSTRVHFLGEVDPRTLRTLYAGSLALVFPSTLESFGLPPLEAMAYGVPVAASRIEPIVEVCGEAAIYFDPENPQEVAKVMIQLATDEELRKSLAARGRIRAGQFSWEKTARRTLEILETAVSQ